jgi:hypothetical protein
MIKNINIDQLLLFSLFSLIDSGRQTTFENLVVECFKLFPNEFGLKGFTIKYPDSSRVDKTWRRCRTDRGWISGSVAHGFMLTPFGQKELDKVKKLLKQDKKFYKFPIIQHGDKRTKSGRILEHIERHKSYLKYLQNKDNPDISDYDVCDLLFCTLDSFPETKRKNLNEIKKLVMVYKRNDILIFLDWIEKNKKYLFLSK